MAYNLHVTTKDINFTVKHGDIFIIMGGSGSGKSTLLRHAPELIVPAKGEIWYGNFDFTKGEPEQRRKCCATSACCTRAARCGAR